MPSERRRGTQGQILLVDTVRSVPSLEPGMSVLSSWLIARAGALSRQTTLTDPRLLKKKAV